MGRKKVKLTLIASESARKTTYKKRKNCMVKKIGELVTLCGVEACMIIYNPNEPQEPVFWPSSTAVQGTILRYKKIPELDKSKKMLNQMSYARDRIQKAKEAMMKVRRSNKEKELTAIMYRFMTNGIYQYLTSNSDLNEMICLVDQKLREANIWMQVMDKNEPQNAIQIQGQEGQGQTDVDTNIRALEGQENFMEMMYFAGGEDEALPFGETDIYNAWPGPFNF